MGAPRYAVAMTWDYFVAKAEDETILIIARRNGPEIQILDRHGQWVGRPQLLTRFQDAGYLEEVTLAEAQSTAAASGMPMASESTSA